MSNKGDSKSKLVRGDKECHYMLVKITRINLQAQDNFIRQTPLDTKGKS